MKLSKWFVLFMIVMLALSSFTPAMAKGPIPPKPPVKDVPISVSIVALQSAPAGSTVRISVTVTPIKRGNNKVDLRMVLPKSTVSNLVLQGTGTKVRPAHTATEFVFLWTGDVKQPMAFTISATLVVDRGGLNFPLISVFNWGKLSASAKINITKPMIWNVAVPNVPAGGEKFLSTVMAMNPSPVATYFDVTVTVIATEGNNGQVSASKSCPLSKLVQTGMTFRWQGTVPAGGNCQLEIYAFSGQTEGVFDLLVVRNMLDLSDGPEGKVFLSASVNVLPAAPALLEWSLTGPESVPYGKYPYIIRVTAKNNSRKDLSFSVSAKLLFEGGTDGSTFPQLNGGDLCEGTHSDGKTGYEMIWCGTVPAGQTFTLDVNTNSGVGPGSYHVFTLNSTSAYQLPVAVPDLWVLHVVPQVPDPYGRLTLVANDMVDPRVIAGNVVLLVASYRSAVPTQFIIGAVTSPDCSILGLPGGSISAPGLTDVTFSYGVQIVNIVKPVGVTDPYYVTCHLNSSFYTGNRPDLVYYGTGSVEVLVP